MKIWKRLTFFKSFGGIFVVEDDNVDENILDNELDKNPEKLFLSSVLSRFKDSNTVFSFTHKNTPTWMSKWVKSRQLFITNLESINSRMNYLFHKMCSLILIRVVFIVSQEQRILHVNPFTFTLHPHASITMIKCQKHDDKALMKSFFRITVLWVNFLFI